MRVSTVRVRMVNDGECRTLIVREKTEDDCLTASRQRRVCSLITVRYSIFHANLFGRRNPALLKSPV